ncbi:S9 family peptidase [uncultured Porphyromonas sp.]|uniref:S9 family peptidase n=1 Tax=uncultured Porphyromonas sp. TaxID=159274 RepID=UPI00260541C8|nr:S9 family peptidase [uncultured Porphyromonas sp.]
MNTIHSSSYPLPPSAEVQEEHLHHLDTERIDPFYYMKDKGDPRLVEYLESENKYTSEVMASTKSLQEQIYQEIVGRMKEDDQSYPTLRRGYYYYTRTEKGKQYPVHYRMREEEFEAKWKDCPTAIEGGELLFDVNQLAEGSDAYIFAGYSVSPNNQLAAYFSNTTGSYAEFDLHLRDLTTGTDRPFTLHGISSLAWAEDSETIYYGLIDETLRSTRIFAQRLSEAEGTLIYEEQDVRFSCSVSETKTREFIFISTSSSTTSEEYYLSSSGEDREPKLFLPRKQDVRYSILSHKGKFFVYYKDKEHLNGMVYVSPKDQVGDPTQWQVFVPHREDVRLDSIGVYREHVALEERREGLTEIRILSHEGAPLSKIHFPEPVYTISLKGNSTYEATTIRYTYSSPNRPTSLYEYDLVRGESRLLKQQEVGGGFSPDDYTVERRWATAPDGVKVPMTLLYRKGLQRDGSAPALLYGYGSYGVTLDAHFSVSVLSLVDRGFVYAQAQVRGGSDLGEQWYEDGKFLKKQNTFTDFIACAETLIQEGYTSPERLTAEGGSAGGLLIGAVANSRPDLFHAMIAAVPFVDVVTTMLDESLPLTTSEYEEWGNPNDPEYFHYMLSYSPYDNLRSQDYPHLLVTGGINDSQVLFHEPTKYVAKLRQLKTDDHLLLLRMDMDSGHGGATGRYDGIRDTAFEYAFLLLTLGML